MPDQKTSLRHDRTICMYFCQKTYEAVVNDSAEFRNVLTKSALSNPEVFPEKIMEGFELKDMRHSIKLKITIRRILIAGVSYSVRPSFAMPYMTGYVSNVEKALFLRKFAVPFWALAYCFGRYSMYWYRQEASLGRYSIVETTIKSADKLPENLSADEKHAYLSRLKVFIACIAGNGCILGAEVCGNADQESLEKGYGVFKEEARKIKQDYSPKTVNTDGWKATMNAWKSMFPSITLISCFLHIYISIRDRASKKYKEVFREVAKKMWDCYHAQTKASFSQKVRRMKEWCQKKKTPQVISDKIDKLNSNLSSFSVAYNFRNAHRTSNMIDRLMQRMDRYIFSIQGFHGKKSSANRSIRAWALIQNFAPWNPYTISKNEGYNCAAEKLNGFRYHDNWLENLLISASLKGSRPPPQNPL